MTCPKRIAAFFIAILMAWSAPMPKAHAQGAIEGATGVTCPKDWHFGEQIMRTCWECFFPLTIFGIPLGGSTSDLPDDRVKSPICLCPGRSGYPSIGFTLGWWSPRYALEFVRQPWCMPSLAGLQLGSGGSGDGGLGIGVPIGRWGGAGDVTDDNVSTYYNFHSYKFPVDYLVGYLSDFACSKATSTGIDIAFMSEFDPSWNNDDLALWTGPEAKIFAAPWAVVACSVDAVASTLNKPMRSLYYCAGSWGVIFPMSGHETSNSDMPRSVSLLAARAMAKQHRFGIYRRTYGNKSICADTMAFTLQKQQYRLQMTFPSVEKSNARMGRSGSGSSNHWIGASSFEWGGEWSTLPGQEDYIYLGWGYNDCCVTLW